MSPWFPSTVARRGTGSSCLQDAQPVRPPPARLHRALDRTAPAARVSSWIVVWSMPKRACSTACSSSSKPLAVAHVVHHHVGAHRLAPRRERPHVQVVDAPHARTARIAASISARSRWGGVPSSRTLTAWRSSRHVRGTMNSAMATLTSGVDQASSPWHDDHGGHQHAQRAQRIAEDLEVGRAHVQAGARPRGGAATRTRGSPPRPSAADHEHRARRAPGAAGQHRR